MAKMSEEDKKELLNDITASASNEDTKVFLTLALTKDGDMSQRGFINGANQFQVVTFLGSLLGAAADMAEQAEGPYKDLIPHLQEMKKMTEVGTMMQMMLRSKQEEQPDPTPDDDKPFDFDFNIPGGK